MKPAGGGHFNMRTEGGCAADKGLIFDPEIFKEYENPGLKKFFQKSTFPVKRAYFERFIDQFLQRRANCVSGKVA